MDTLWKDVGFIYTTFRKKLKILPHEEFRYVNYGAYTNNLDT